MLEAKILDTSSSSFRSQLASFGSALLVSLKSATHNLLSFADLRDVVKKFRKIINKLN